MSSVTDLQARYLRIAEAQGKRSMPAIKAWTKLQAAVHSELAEKDRIHVSAVRESRV